MRGDGGGRAALLPGLEPPDESKPSASPCARMPARHSARLPCLTKARSGCYRDRAGHLNAQTMISTVSNPKLTTALALSLALALLIALPGRAPARIGGFALVTSAAAEPTPPADADKTKPTKAQKAKLAAYEKALAKFKKILAERRVQIEANKIDAKKKLPRLPGQAIYLARLHVMSTYKDLTDAWPARIGRENKFGVPPAYFDADIEPLVDEYAELFRIMQAPPEHAQASDTPLEDVVVLARAIARAKGLDADTAEAAGRIGLALFFAETGGNQNIGNARSNKYKGSLQTSVGEDRKGQRRWAAIKDKVAAIAPKVAARDEKEEARVGSGDQRYNHWTAVRNGLMASHAELFAEIPEIARMLPDEIDQMKLFELIQIVPAPTLAALKSGSVADYKVTSPRIMGYLRNNSIFTFGKDREKTSATYREILDAMWLFARKFERARAKYAEIKDAEVKAEAAE